MWRLAIIFLLTSAASGQEFPQSDVRIQSAGLDVGQVCTITRYNKLRQGHDEQVAIFPQTSPSNCINGPDIPSMAVRVYSKSLELEPQEGFSFKYSNGLKFKTLPGPSINTKGGLIFLVQLKAARQLPPGNYTIRGKLTLIQAVNRISSTRELDVAMPITVVDHDAKIEKNPWKYELHRGHPVRGTLLMVALSPFILIYMTMWLIACEFDKCDS